MNEEKTKSFPVSKRMVYDSYLKVMSKKMDVQVLMVKALKNV